MDWYGWVKIQGQWQRVTGPHPNLSACSRALEKIATAKKVKNLDQRMTTGCYPRD